MQYENHVSYILHQSTIQILTSAGESLTNSCHAMHHDLVQQLTLNLGTFYNSCTFFILKDPLFWQHVLTYKGFGIRTIHPEQFVVNNLSWTIRHGQFVHKFYHTLYTK